MVNLRKHGKVIENANLKAYNTYRVDSTCQYLVFPEDTSKLQALVTELDNSNYKYKILGNGSNIIFSQKHYKCIFIKTSLLHKISFNENIVTAEAGVLLPVLVQGCIKKNFTGLEFASGIPGTIGGAIIGNAGAYNECIFDYVQDITVIDSNYKIKTLSKEKIEYSYRHTSLKDKNYVILSANLTLKNGDITTSKELIRERTQKRKDTQPLEYPSAGSVFRNPENNFAGKLIEDCGLKGKSIGGAQISEKHANFIINTGNASGEDICELIELIKNTVLKQTGIELVLEQEII
ncbi:UDP-N-acetylmuramate dehydrogenase [bacterium]|nr:UDP-N-acetylmuramate dehydrogenase [bacterium]